MRYLLDANTYIQAKNQYYGMDICSAYWDWLNQQFQFGVVASIHMIAKELKDSNDELASWVKERPAHFIANGDVNMQSVFAQIAHVVATGDYNLGNRDKFLAKADPWIIAKAKTIGATIVTHEALAAANTKKIKVPNICLQFDVPCVNTFQFLRELKARFVLSV
ncbi:DUF4411 family protein [Undibacterium flavidum]|uniref:DUF4411 family protein n=1 Tax=Undibacterium flavidum TaxID=2762297 RepID=A0ABR6YF14_9BURK|nr:DUF4411 family protein [Undibacterium flavidum]MBC3875137.1 DUF4411 family protein [Undibacterium flavidum]